VNDDRVGASLLPLLAAIAMVFLETGAALSAVPLFVRDSLGFGPGVIGMAAGGQFVAAVVSRIWAGNRSDFRGPKQAVIAGLATASVAGLFYLVSVLLAPAPLVAAAALLTGRALLGGAHSFIITGAQAWGFLVAGPEHTAKVIGLTGSALFISLAVGAPLGSALQARWGFAAIALFTLLSPLVTLAAIVPMKSVRATTPRSRVALRQLIRPVLAPASAMALAGFGYSAMLTFSVLLFVERGWRPAWLTFSLFAAALVVARVTFGELPDRWGGARTATAFLAVQAVGLALIALSPSAVFAFAGSFVAGVGYAYIYPALGRIAVHRSPPERAGRAMAAFSAVFETALGVSSPLLGFTAAGFGTGSVFLIAAATSLLALLISLRLGPVRSSERAR
jgi:MFS family permease